MWGWEVMGNFSYFLPSSLRKPIGEASISHSASAGYSSRWQHGTANPSVYPPITACYWKLPCCLCPQSGETKSEIRAQHPSHARAGCSSQGKSRGSVVWLSLQAGFEPRPRHLHHWSSTKLLAGRLLHDCYPLAYHLCHHCWSMDRHAGQRLLNRCQKVESEEHWMEQFISKINCRIWAWTQWAEHRQVESLGPMPGTTCSLPQALLWVTSEHRAGSSSLPPSSLG